MSERRTKLWRKEFRKRWKFDADAFINDVIDLEFKWRLGLCYRVLFKRKSNREKKQIWWPRIKEWWKKLINGDMKNAGWRWVKKQLERMKWK